MMEPDGEDSGGTMPVFQRSTDGATALALSTEGGREVVYRLSREGVLFLTEILGVRDGDEFRPTDLQLLVDRDWAAVELPPVLSEPAPAPAPAPPSVPPRVKLGLESRKAAPSPSPAPSPTAARSALSRRTRGREVALQVLYLLEQNGTIDRDWVETFIARRLGDDKLADFTLGLVDGVRDRQPEIDETLGTVAENWRVDRMTAIDRNILRLGAFEILHRPDVPRKVAINEALELAKRYSTAQSSRFVNGILDRLQPEGPSSEAEPDRP